MATSPPTEQTEETGTDPNVSVALPSLDNAFSATTKSAIDFIVENVAHLSVMMDSQKHQNHDSPRDPPTEELKRTDDDVEAQRSDPTDATKGGDTDCEADHEYTHDSDAVKQSAYGNHDPWAANQC